METPTITDICTLDSTDSLGWAIEKINALIENQAKIAEVLARHGLVQLEFNLPDLPRNRDEPATAQALALQPCKAEKNTFK